MYDGYRIGGMDIYHPWSVINYAKRGILDNYWVKTSADFQFMGASCQCRLSDCYRAY